MEDSKRIQRLEEYVVCLLEEFKTLKYYSSDAITNFEFKNHENRWGCQWAHKSKFELGFDLKKEKKDD